MIRNKAVSVVVPVYNTEAYLRECLDSLAGQTLGDSLEVLLVDDGSTDSSGKICDEYASRYPAIFRVFHKSNGGSASAREVGWQAATGTYITVCDSDDWVEPDMYESLYNKAMTSDSDMVICDMFYNYSDGRQAEVILDYGTELTPSGVTASILRNNACGSTCSKLSRRELFVANGLHWAAGINLGEDALMLLKYLQIDSLKITRLNRCLYHYRRRVGENTYTNNITFAKWQQLQQVDRWKCDNLTEPIFKDGLTVSAIDLAFAYLRTTDTSLCFRHIAPERLKFRCLLAAPSPWPKKAVIAFAGLFGIKAARKLVNLLYTHFYK